MDCLHKQELALEKRKNVPVSECYSPLPEDQAEEKEGERRGIWGIFNFLFP